jgi:hypothetical protein
MRYAGRVNMTQFVADGESQIKVSVCYCGACPVQKRVSKPHEGLGRCEGPRLRVVSSGSYFRRQGRSMLMHLPAKAVPRIG